MKIATSSRVRFFTAGEENFVSDTAKDRRISSGPGAVVNVIILRNTLYINAALEQLKAEGYPIPSEDVARLSPLVFDHINLLGRYAFSVPDSVIRANSGRCGIRLRRWRMLREPNRITGLTLTRFFVPLIPTPYMGGST